MAEIDIMIGTNHRSIYKWY